MNVYTYMSMYKTILKYQEHLAGTLSKNSII